ncbi:MAG: hypothetical protein FJ320_09200 [SAR202 cluster bacterium]|nr:hypothetical protein [SAR202 cluster bacterium]
MPMMLGFSQHRAGMLQEELDRMIQELPQLGVRRCILLNPLYPGSIEVDTSLKLVMVLDDDRPFVRRPDFFYGHLWPRVAVEFIHLTPEEFDAVEPFDTELGRAIRRGEVVYDA